MLVAMWLPSMSWGLGEEVRLSRSQIQKNYCNLLSSIEAEFEAYYAPRHWKEEYDGWNLHDAVEKCKLRILNETSSERQTYQRIIRDFFASTHDYHVGVSFLNWDVSFLPFSVITAEGRTFISHVNRRYVSESVFPFEKGDEIIEFDGHPVSEQLEKLAHEINGSNPASNQGIADSYLTFHASARGDICPQGPINLKIRPKDSEQIQSVQLIWLFNECPCCRDPEILEASIAMELPQLSNRMASTDPKKLQIMVERFFNPKAELPHMEVFKRRNKALEERYGNRFALGSTYSMLPQLGAMWWQAQPIQTEWGSFLPFHSYIYQNPGSSHKVGFIRIASYGGGALQASVFEEIIAKMEEEVDLLVLDQTNNPGGSVAYLYALASMLSTETLATPQHQLALCEEDYTWAKYLHTIFSYFITSDEEAQWVLGESWGGYPVTYHLVQMWMHHLKFVIDSWEKGEILTPPIHLAGVDQINPHPTTRFSKPILLLTNAMNFSGGDFFPAIMQDNERVTILGSRTAGAGGCVVEGHANTSDHSGLLSFRLTNTLAWRPGGLPIEDLGVEPDHFYQLTAEDVQNNCRGFVEAIHENVSKIIFSHGL